MWVLSCPWFVWGFRDGDRALTVVEWGFYNSGQMAILNSAWMRVLFVLACLLGGLSFGCRSTGPTSLPTEQDRVAMLSLMLPHELKIQPFTKVASFNEDELPDGILTVIRPLDRFGDPVKAVGLFYFELWTYVEASGERKGERLGFWERTIDSADEVRLYWTRGQMYEFQLAWTAGAETIRPGQKYVLTATYRTPWDVTIQDEHVVEFPVPAGPMGKISPAESGF